MLIVLNDNDMSIDENVGALSAYMTKLTTSKRYNNLRYKTYQSCAATTSSPIRVRDWCFASIMR